MSGFTTPDPNPPLATSRRLQAAARAEAIRLFKRRDRLSARIAPLQAEINRIDEQVARIGEAAGLVLSQPMEPGSKNWPPAKIEGVTLTAIRIQAVRSMLDRHCPGYAAHAREWYAAFTADGYVIAANDPFAAFLTQLSRSPWVESSSQRGIYALGGTRRSRAFARRSRVYEQAQAATDAGEKMGLLREARRLIKLRDEAEDCIATLPVTPSEYEPMVGTGGAS